VRYFRVFVTAAALAGLAGACSSATAAPGSATAGVITAVGAENEYANVISQIGGQYVRVSAILNDPNTDPHTFESSASVARTVAHARIAIQNGLGYDGFMDRIESAAPNSGRKVIVVQRLLGLPNSTPNPHLWYDPRTMPAVAAAVAGDLSAIEPAHAAYFQANLSAFDRALRPWLDAITGFRTQYGGTPVATTEPVADYLLQAMGADNLTPFRFQAAMMNGTDPAPQDISLMQGLFSGHRVKVFCYNQQVVSSLTSSIRKSAGDHGIPVVGVSETMPPGYDYQTWMLAETRAIQAAVAHGTSTEHL
jgi:zinc/manganese transport system substrate-binding protein